MTAVRRLLMSPFYITWFTMVSYNKLMNHYQQNLLQGSEIVKLKVGTPSSNYFAFTGFRNAVVVVSP